MTGFNEVDLVSHWVNSANGELAHTLNPELRVLLEGKSEIRVQEARQEILWGLSPPAVGSHLQTTSSSP